jgi:hypothetical protein
MPRVRVHSLATSLDGYAGGPDQSVDHPLGVGGTRLHEWVFETRTGRKMIALDGGTEGIVCSPAVAHVRLARTTR